MLTSLKPRNCRTIVPKLFGFWVTPAALKRRGLRRRQGQALKAGSERERDFYEAFDRHVRVDPMAC